MTYKRKTIDCACKPSRRIKLMHICLKCNKGNGAVSLKMFKIDKKHILKRKQSSKSEIIEFSDNFFDPIEDANRYETKQ